MAGRTLAPVYRPTLVLPPAVSLQASAQRMDPAVRKGEEAIPGESAAHREAWCAYDEIGEVRTIVSSSAALISRCVLYAGFVDDQGEDRRLRDENGKVVPPFTEQLVADAEFVLARYVDAAASQRGILNAQSQNYDVTGDGYLVGWPVDADGKPWNGDEAAKAGERWEFVARDAIATKVVGSTSEGKADTRWTIRLAVGDLTVLPAAANVHRMKQRHPRRPDEAPGWVISSLDICRDLRVFTLLQRAAARSGIPAKILVAAQQADPRKLTARGGPMGGQTPSGQPYPQGPIVAEQISGNFGGSDQIPVPQGFPNARPQRGGPGSPPSEPEAWAQHLDSLIGEFVFEAIGDAQSGRTVWSPVLTVDEKFVQSFNLLDLSRPIDSQLSVLITQAITRLATVADAAPEMLPGLGKTNRWNGAQIALDEYRRYFAPKLDSIADDWTTDLLWAGLRDLGYREDMVRSVRVLVDPRPILTEPDRATSSTEGVKIGALSLAAWRSANGYTEPDAPTPEEQAMLLAAFGHATAAPNPPQSGGVNMQVGSAAFQADVTTAPPALLAAPGYLSPNGTRQAATHAPSTRSGQTLAQQLVTVETTARTRLEEAAEAALDSALARAGAKLKSYANGNRDLRATLLTVDARDVPGILGADRARSLVAAQFASEQQRREDLFAAVLITLLASYHRITSAAYASALKLLHVKVTQPGESAPAGWDAIPAAEVARNIDTGGVVLRESMLALADREVFDPVLAPAIGELSSFRVPAPVIRRTLAAAGGSSVEPGLTPFKEPGGLVFGPTLAAHEPQVLGWVWVYGDEPRRQPYEPHLELDGGVFSGPDDPSLEGIEPDGGPGWPGGHDGCRCDAEPEFVEATEVGA